MGAVFTMSMIRCIPRSILRVGVILTGMSMSFSLIGNEPGPTQLQSLYLIVAEPFGQKLGLQTNAILLEVREGELVQIKNFSTPIDFVRTYHSHGLAILGRNEREGMTLEVIPMEAPLLMRQYYYEYCEDCASSPLVHFLGGSDEPALMFTIGRSSGELVDFGSIGLLSGRTRSLARDDYALVHSYGISGARVSGGDHLYVVRDYFEDTDQAIVGPGIELGWTVPHWYSGRHPERIRQVVNNHHIRVITSDTLGSVDGRNRHFFFQNKLSGEWHSHGFPGSASAIRGFDEWVALEHVTQPFRAGSPDLRLISGPSIGGVNYLNSRMRMLLFKLNPTGHMYLYNAHERYEIAIDVSGDAGSFPDCEILLVQEEMVYYRVGQSIYKARIDRSTNGVNDVTLVVEHPYVSHAHWAFLGMQADSALVDTFSD